MTTNDFLDHATWIGQRASSFVYELIDGGTGRTLQEVTPSRATVPTLSHDVSRTIKRQLGPLTFDEVDSAVIDPVTQRIRVTMLLETGDTFPLGTFVFTDSTTSIASRGSIDNTSLLDTGFIIDQPVQHTFSIPANTSIATAMANFIDELALSNRPQIAGGLSGSSWYPNPLEFITEIEGSGVLAGSAMTWGAGTTGLQIVEDMAAFGGWFSPWIDASNHFHAVLAFDPADRVPVFDYDDNPSMVRNAIASTDDLLSAPNRFIVIDNSNTNAPVVGLYDIPPSAPHSIVRRGFVVPFVQDTQGVGGGVQTSVPANEAARALGLQKTAFSRISFTTAADPRHDAYDVIRFQGVNWLEVGWAMSLAPGGPMTHIMQRAYSG